MLTTRKKKDPISTKDLPNLCSELPNIVLYEVKTISNQSIESLLVATLSLFAKNLNLV